MEEFTGVGGKLLFFLFLNTANNVVIEDTGNNLAKPLALAKLYRYCQSVLSIAKSAKRFAR